jgi:hypothetical protein
MLEYIGTIASDILNARGFPTLLLTWQLWALLSEVLLACTHLKVLLCIGKPIPVKDLSSKRWTYFLYDLLSPWASLVSIVAPHVLRILAARAGSSSLMTAIVGQDVAGSSSSSVQLLEACTPLIAVPYPQAPGYCSSYMANSTDWYSAVNNTTSAAAPAPATPPLASYNVALLPSMQPAAVAASRAAAQSSLQQVLLLFVGAHAALHVYYIASWHTKHSRNVVSMSASSSMTSRAQQFRFWEVVWFFIGTSYDIATHVVMCGLLLQHLGSSYNSLWV